MILHIVTFDWVEGVVDSDVTALTQALTEMAANVPELLSYVAGPNLRVRPGADYGVAAIVSDEDALARYLDHPLHTAVYERFLGTMLASRTAAQLPLAEGALR